MTSKLLGYSHTELMSMTVDQVDTMEEARHVPERIARLMDQGHLTFETVHQHKDGFYIPIDVNARQITWEQQPALMSICRDITARKQTEDKLRKSEKKYRALLQTTSEGFWLLNTERKTVEVNESLCKMLGYRQDEMLGKTPFDFVDDENRRVFIEQTSKISTTEHRSYEIVLKTKKGDNLYTYFKATTIKNESGEVQGSFAFITNITGKKKLEEALRESEEKYRSMMEAMEDPVYICSMNLLVEYMNPAMIKVAGYDAIGKSCSQAIYGLSEKCPWCVQDRIQKGESVQTELINPKNDHAYSVIHSPIFHTDNKISKMTIFRDITQRKRLEEDREKFIKELQNALSEIKTLSGLLPICSYCKKIRDDKGYWNQIESYIQEHSTAEFSHSICQECAKKYYADLDLYNDEKDQA
jgi:PAS domain S-box-containing protein